MSSIIVRISRADSEWLPKTGDYDSFILRYSIVTSDHIGKPDEKIHTRDQSIKIKVSRSTQNDWKLIRPNTDLDKVVFQYGLDLIEQNGKSDSLEKEEEILLFDDAPQNCPYDPKKIHEKYDLPIEIFTSKPFGFTTR